MIDWKKYTDNVFIISYVKNFKRREILKEEFKRLGLNDYEFKLSVSPKIIKESSFEFGPKYKDNSLYSLFKHYESIKEAYMLDYERIIIMEDDARFLNDIDIIEDQLNKYYDKGDIVLFDYINMNSDSDKNIYAYLLSTCYLLNRNGMKYMIDNVEDHIYNIDCYFTNQDITVYGEYDGTVYHVRKYINASDINPIIIPLDKHICIQLDENNNINEYHFMFEDFADNVDIENYKKY